MLQHEQVVEKSFRRRWVSLGPKAGRNDQNARTPERQKQMFKHDLHHVFILANAAPDSQPWTATVLTCTVDQSACRFTIYVAYESRSRLLCIPASTVTIFFRDLVCGIYITDKIVVFQAVELFVPRDFQLLPLCPILWAQLNVSCRQNSGDFTTKRRLL